jgi:endonuclease YncB( thermonuclease family)
MRKFLYIALTVIAIILFYQGLQKIGSSQGNLGCTVIKGSVFDGDTLRVKCQGEKLRIRFACVDAPEIRQENGIASRDHLRSIINRSNNQIAIKTVDVDRYGRIVAEVYANNELVQLQQARDGMVWAYEKYKRNCPHWKDVNKAFSQARSQKRGIFLRQNAIPPWEWRKQERRARNR